MNAYELADALKNDWADKFRFDAADMLRQQADRIAELEKKGKPTAWIRSGDDQLSLVKEKDDGYMVWKPLYTTPQTKPLSDEEIVKEWNKFYPDVFHTHLIDFVRAIEERHGIK